MVGWEGGRYWRDYYSVRVTRGRKGSGEEKKKETVVVVVVVALDEKKVSSSSCFRVGPNVCVTMCQCVCMLGRLHTQDSTDVAV